MMVMIAITQMMSVIIGHLCLKLKEKSQRDQGLSNVTFRGILEVKCPGSVRHDVTLFDESGKEVLEPLYIEYNKTNV